LLLELSNSIKLLIPTSFSSLNFFVRRAGGAFGGKISRQGQIACAAAIGCHLSQRPVRLIMSMEDNMQAIGKRFSALSDYEIEVDAKGKVQKLKTHYIQDLGSSLNEPVQFNTSVFIKNCYETKAWNVTTQSALTNSASNTWMRAPGTTEAIAMAEHMMDHVARVVGRDPVDVRIDNLEDDSVFKEMLPEFVQSIGELLLLLASSSFTSFFFLDYRERKAEIEAFNAANRWIKRGIAVVPMKYFIFYTGTMHGTVSIYHGDGSVALATGGIEMGQGLNTKMTQVAAHVLGLPMDRFSVKPSNTLMNANDVGSVASVTSEISCYVIKNACEMLNERLKPVREANPTATWEELVEIAFQQNLDLSATYAYSEKEMHPYYVYGSSCAEVEVDFLTGNMLLKRVDILEDTGESMSPGMDIGQIEGGFVMGLGIWLTENLIYDPKTAELLTNRSWNYKVPGAKDIPIDFRIRLLQKKPNPYFVLRSKATGEPPVTMGKFFSTHKFLNLKKPFQLLLQVWLCVTQSTAQDETMASRIPIGTRFQRLFHPNKFFWQLATKSKATELIKHLHFLWCWLRKSVLSINKNIPSTLFTSLLCNLLRVVHRETLLFTFSLCNLSEVERTNRG